MMYRQQTMSGLSSKMLQPFSAERRNNKVFMFKNDANTCKYQWQCCNEMEHVAKTTTRRRTRRKPRNEQEESEAEDEDEGNKDSISMLLGRGAAPAKCEV